MAKISIEVGRGDGDFTIMRDGEVFSLREGETAVLVAEDVGQMVLSGDHPLSVVQFIYETDLDRDGDGDDEPDEAPAHPAAANDAAPQGMAMAA